MQFTVKYRVRRETEEHYQMVVPAKSRAEAIALVLRTLAERDDLYIVLDEVIAGGSRGAEPPTQEER